MIVEAITIGVILVASGAVAWISKIKFQPEIERSLIKVEAKEETVVAKSR